MADMTVRSKRLTLLLGRFVAGRLASSAHLDEADGLCGESLGFGFRRCCCLSGGCGQCLGSGSSCRSSASIRCCNVDDGVNVHG
jgi:hypothetical protein